MKPHPRTAAVLAALAAFAALAAISLTAVGHPGTGAGPVARAAAAAVCEHRGGDVHQAISKH